MYSNCNIAANAEGLSLIHELTCDSNQYEKVKWGNEAENEV